MWYDKTCTIYPFETSIVDEQEVEGYSTTASYTWPCDYWEWNGKYQQDIVVQHDRKMKYVDLPWIVWITNLSKVVLDNWKTFKVFKVEPFPGPDSFAENTLLHCDYTDGN